MKMPKCDKSEIVENLTPMVKKMHRGLHLFYFQWFGRMQYYLPTELMDFIIDKAWSFGIR